MISDNTNNYEFGELEIEDIRISHLHDKNGENWFDDNAGASLLGITPRAYRKLVKSVEDDCASFGTVSTKTLRVAKTGRPRRFSNFGMIVMTASRSRSDKAMSIVILAGNLLNEKYNQVQGYTKKIDSTQALEQDARKTIQHLKNKMWEEATLAFEAKTKQEFIHHMDLADKYGMDANKRYQQLKNVINCDKRLARELELNRQGVLTESGNTKVFIPTNQTRLTDFNNSKNNFLK